MPDAVHSSTPARRLRGIVVVLLMLGVAAAVSGVLYENIFEARDRRFNPMPGRLVDMGGMKMHIDCTGDGTPTVILESGLGDSYISWRKAQPLMAKFTRVCSYDRAGLGYSDSSSRPRTSRNMAEELHALLHSAGIAPPYVLVGHSMGGFDVRLYASLYRSEVTGVVLVDSSHPDQRSRLPAGIGTTEGGAQREAEFLAYTMPFGIPRLVGLCDDDPVGRAADCNLHSAREVVAEMKALPESCSQATASGSLGDLPLVVLSRDPDRPSADLPRELAKPTSDAWEKMQGELAHLSTRGVQTVVKNSGHYIQIDQPEVVAETVHNVVNQARAEQAALAPKP